MFKMKLRKKSKQKKTLIRLNKEEFPKRLKAESNSSKETLKLNEKQVRERLKKLKVLRVKLARINFVITWDSFIKYIHQETSKKIEGNYSIIYARYLEDNLHELYDKFMDMRRTRRSAMVVKSPSRVYERIDDKIDIKYISNLERRLGIFYKKIKLLKKEINSSEAAKSLLKKKLLQNKQISENIAILQRRTNIVEKKVNEYITVRLEYGKTYIYVNGKRFIQCIRLILNIPKEDVEIYDEINSIDEAAKLYSDNLFQNRLVRGPMAVPLRNQMHDVTAEQEFWGHCSNIQAWVEHDYDTRILMSNISFPLLRVLSQAGDPLAKKVFKEEIALRLESGYPSVVQYLINQGYISHFTPSEFKSILETTNLIKNLSSEPRMLNRFLNSCISRFSIHLRDILLEILQQPNGKDKLISSISLQSVLSNARPHLRFNPRLLSPIKKALEDILLQVDETRHEEIIDCINIIENSIEKQNLSLPRISGSTRLDFIRNRILRENLNGADLGNLNDPNFEEKLQAQKKLFGEFRRVQSKCRYCGKMIRRGQDTCDWCGHRRDDDEGFFPYPFIFKPPGGGGRLREGAIAIPIRT